MCDGIYAALAYFKLIWLWRNLHSLANNTSGNTCRCSLALVSFAVLLSDWLYVTISYTHLTLPTTPYV